MTASTATDHNKTWLFQLISDETPAPVPAYIVGDVSACHLLDDRVVGTSAEQVRRVAQGLFLLQTDSPQA
jgi:hypothetical protein